MDWLALEEKLGSVIVRMDTNHEQSQRLLSELAELYQTIVGVRLTQDQDRKEGP